MSTEETFDNTTRYKVGRTNDIDLGSQNGSTAADVPADYIGTVGVIKQNINIPD